MHIHRVAGLSLDQVNLNDVSDCPGPYCMSFGSDLKALIRSIQSVGLINYPLVIKDKGEMLTVVVGYRRILALKSLGWEKTPCRILSGSELSPLECLLLNLHDNLSSRELNEVEKGMVLRRLTSYVSDEEILEKYAPLLGLPRHKSTLLLFLRLEKELDKEAKEHIVQGRLSLQAVKMLLDIDQDARTHVFHFISTLKLNTNQQRQLVEYLIDLSHIESKSVSQVLNDGPFERIYSDTQVNRPQKAKAVIRLLRARRFPTLVSAEKTFKKKVAGLNLPDGVKISAPPHFEASDYRLEVLFRNGRELAERIDHLSRTEGLEDLGDPWERGV